MALSGLPIQAGSFDFSDLQGETTMLAQGREGQPPVHGYGVGKTGYERHQPEQIPLYQLVEAHYPTLVDQLVQQGKSLPEHVHLEFAAYL